MTVKKKGTLIIIGGHESYDGDMAILKEVAAATDRRKDRGRLVVVTAAAYHPEKTAQTYTQLFTKLGVSQVDVVDVRSRDDAHDEEKVRLVEQAASIFFTGGDQLRITSQIGDSPLYRCMKQLYEHGATIAGTSAGAAAMPETMVVSGEGDESNRISALGMAPGLGLLEGAVIDSHFAQRGRMGRLLGAVVQNPRNLGIGIDEDTAIVVKDDRFEVIGSGAVYVVDGSTISYSSLSEEKATGIVSIFDVRLHVLGEGDSFHLGERLPIGCEMEQERA